VFYINISEINSNSIITNSTNFIFCFRLDDFSRLVKVKHDILFVVFILTAFFTVAFVQYKGTFRTRIANIGKTGLSRDSVNNIKKH